MTSRFLHGFALVLACGIAGGPDHVVRGALIGLSFCVVCALAGRLLL